MFRNTNQDITVTKTFLITGGTPEERKEKSQEVMSLISRYCSCAYSSYQSDNEIAIVCSNNASDFKSMTFAKAKKLAGEEKLIWDFQVRGPQFGIIDLSAKARPRARL